MTQSRAMTEGEVDEGYGPVADAFRLNFSRYGEVGASFCVYREGKKVVDLWGGVVDRDSARPWQRDTLITVFSATKGLAALACLMLADRGKLDYDQPVAVYWPEFARNGKEPITVRQLLNHTSGLSALDIPLSADDVRDPNKVLVALESQQPMWEPGKGQGYGAISWGLYVSELFFRVAAESAGTFFRREVTQALQADAWLGLPESENHRVGTLYPVSMPDRLLRTVPQMLFCDSTEARIGRAMVRRSSATARAFLNPSPGPEAFAIFNRPEIWAMELLWANAIANGRGLARVYSALAGDGSLEGVRLVQPQTLLPLHTAQTWQRDAVLHKEQGWSQGFLKDLPDLFSPQPESFGHPGMGGSFGWADPVHKLGVGYAMNRMDYRIRSPRSIRLCKAVYKCL